MSINRLTDNTGVQLPANLIHPYRVAAFWVFQEKKNDSNLTENKTNMNGIYQNWVL